MILVSVSVSVSVLALFAVLIFLCQYLSYSLTHSDVTRFPRCNAGSFRENTPSCARCKSTTDPPWSECWNRCFLSDFCSFLLAMSSDYITGLQGSALERYKEKLSLCSLEDCPYRLPANVWKNEPSEWPPLDFSGIFFYLVETPGDYALFFRSEMFRIRY